MKIMINPYLKKIDTNNVMTYNTRMCAFKRADSDSFCLSCQKGDVMNITDELNKLKDSKPMNNSIVSFIPATISDYFDGKLSKDEFSAVYTSQMNKAKFYLSLMNRELIQENKTVFKEEFKFADKISIALKKAKEQDNETFKKDLTELIKEYNKNYHEDN